MPWLGILAVQNVSVTGHHADSREVGMIVVISEQ